jgi:hypothetical protein
MVPLHLLMPSMQSCTGAQLDVGCGGGLCGEAMLLPVRHSIPASRHSEGGVMASGREVVHARLVQVALVGISKATCSSQYCLGRCASCRRPKSRNLGGSV